MEGPATGWRRFLDEGRARLCAPPHFCEMVVSAQILYGRRGPYHVFREVVIEGFMTSYHSGVR